MYVVFIVLIVIASVLLALTVLAQSPKSGMAANFGASNQVMGARQTTNFLEKLTWGLAVGILLLSLGATMSMPKGKIDASRSGLEKALIEQKEEKATFAVPNEFGEVSSEETTQEDVINPFATETTETTVEK